MTIKNLLTNSLGVSKELDTTLAQITKSFESLSNAVEREAAEESVKRLRKKVKELQSSLTDVKLYYENKDIDDEEISRAELAIRNRFVNNPQIYYWYETNYNHNFFTLVEPAKLREKIAAVLIDQCNKLKIENYPKLWDAVVANRGLMDSITE